MISLTESAKKYLSDEITQNGAVGCIVEIVSGGCSGMMYKFSLAGGEYDGEKDEIIQCENFKIFIKSNAVLFLVGTKLDYEKTVTGAKLVFKNPNEKNICGCGKSFSF